MPCRGGCGQAVEGCVSYTLLSPRVHLLRGRLPLSGLPLRRLLLRLLRLLLLLVPPPLRRGRRLPRRLSRQRHVLMRSLLQALMLLLVAMLLQLLMRCRELQLHLGGIESALHCHLST